MSRDHAYYLVILTKQNKLIDVRVRAPSISMALDRVIEANGLAGQIADYKFVVVPDAPLETAGKVPNCS